ncbi:hypothetical protein [Arthrobacter sp. STN4]|uniref:hypothetical protein n=1 Tax=Arthrobacter sp. STN4 TaxID=2923276 RepID=UPI00211A0A85|nr:hypothetical protein [Arthrobacter sp. STN4]MCQ9163354.1 hypothetical protein [Arthrobacter sp. STN4]
MTRSRFGIRSVMMTAALALTAGLSVTAAGTAAVAAAPATLTVPLCQPLTAPPDNTFPGTTVVADNFESGTLLNWAVKTGGDGTASVVGTPTYTGGCAGYLHTSSSKGSVANLQKAIPSGTAEVYADGEFNLATAGTTGATNPYFRFFNGTTRIASVYRYATNGQLWLETLSPTAGWVRTRLTTAAVPLSAWNHVQAAFLPNGAATTVQVWLNNSLVYSSTGVNGPTVPVTSVMLGSESKNQKGDLYLDNVIIKAATAAQTSCSATPPANTMPGQTVVADGFECGNLANWTVHMAGDGTAGVQSSTVYDGTLAASLVTTSNTNSLANMSTALPAGTTQTDVDGWFDITAIGPDGNDVPYFRFFTGTTRFADVYRYNSTGQLWLRVLTPAGTYSYVRLTSYSVPLDSWHRVQMEVVPNGTASTIQVWFDGALLYNSSAVSTSATNVTTVMLGSEHYPQPASINIDDVIVKAVVP